MKASFFKTTGGPEVLEFGDFKNPVAKDGEVLVKVKACAINRLDIWLRSGRYKVELAHILGSDIAGINMNTNKEVIVNPAIQCENCENCKKGDECKFVKIFGFHTQGGYGEFVSVPEEQLYPKPIDLSFNEAATFPLTFLTAWRMLVTRGQIKKGETVFIWGASGGLGQAGIQIAKHFGAKVIGASRIDAGADFIVNHHEADVVEEVEKITNGKGVDLVFESVGKDTISRSLRMLKPCGRVVLAGTTSGMDAHIDLSDLYTRQISIIGSRMGTRREFEQVLAFIDKSKIKIAKVFGLNEAKEAHEFMEKSGYVGKIVLEVS